MTKHMGMGSTTWLSKRRAFIISALCEVLAVLMGAQIVSADLPAPVAERLKNASFTEGTQAADADAGRAFARTAQKGHCTIEALKESGEHGGGLCPTTEDAARFTVEGNEAFGECMRLWNQHRWDEARTAMIKFSSDYPNDPWRGESDLHVACYHKFRGENSEAETILARLHEQNKDNAIGRKALVRLSRVYFDTYRYQAAYEALCTLVTLDPIEHEKSYALNWLPHVSSAWMNAAAGRECGPKAFGFAAWLQTNQDRVREHRNAEFSRNAMTHQGREHPAYLPPLSFAQVAEACPWAAQKGGTNGVSLAQMRDLLAQDGWSMETRSVSYDELQEYVSEDRAAVLCLPVPTSPRFRADDGVAAAIGRKLSEEKMFAGGREAANLGHYMVLVKATPRNAWVLDPENGMLQKDALALKDLWLRGRGRGLAVFLSRPGAREERVKAAQTAAADRAGLPGAAVGRAEESAFFGGCCGHETNNDDCGCGNDGNPWCPAPKTGCRSCSRGMPEHQVNTLNMNYLVVDTPLWSETPGGPDLELTLTYNNRESYNAKYSITNVQFYPFGCRWSAPYDSNYALDPASNILVRFPNGMEEYFDHQNNGSYLPRDVRYLNRMDLTVLSNQEVRVDLQGGLTRFYYQAMDPQTNLLQQTLYRVENQFGVGINIYRDSNSGRFQGVYSDVTGVTFIYRYDGNGNIYRVEEYDNTGAATGRRASFSYQRTGGVSRLRAMTDMGGYTTTFTYGNQTYNVTTNDYTTQSVTSSHHIVSYTWPNGGSWSFNLHQTHYDDAHKYTQPLELVITDPLGNDTVYNSYSYGNTGPVGKRDRNGASWFWGLDDVGGATLGKHSTLVNDRQGGVFTRNGEYVDYRQYSSSGRREVTFERHMTEPVTGGLGYTIAAIQDSYNTASAPRKDTWYAYQSSANGGRTVTVSNAVVRSAGGTAMTTNAWTETVELSACDEVVRTVDLAGNSVYLDRDTNRLVTAVRIQPAGESQKTVWQAAYNSWGQMVTQTVDEALQAVVAYQYDSSRRLARILHPDGTSESFGYDPSTHFLAAYTNRTGQGVQFTRDAMGRTIRADFADGTSVTNHYGCCAADAVTDRHGVTARFGYDPDKRLSTAVIPMNAATDTCVKYGYLGEGELGSLGYGPTFSNLATRTFGYTVTNGAARLASRTTPLGKTTDAWTHTFTGLPASHTDGRGVRATNVWDAAKGLLLESTAFGAAQGLDDVAVSCGYDALDRLTNAVRTVAGAETWRESYGYDSRSRPVRADTRVQNLPGQSDPLSYSVTYAYDARGLVTNRTLTVGQTVIPSAYAYDDALPRLSSLSDPYARAEYRCDPLGRLSAVVCKNSQQSVIGNRLCQYDSLSRLSSLSVSNQTDLLWGSSYAYDVDRLASVTVTSGGAARATAYAYDLQGQLTGATGYTPTNTLDAVERFTYDSAGNLTARSLSAPPSPSGREGAAAIFPNADDEAAVYRRHYAATLTGAVDSNAVLSLPLAGKVAVERDARGNWIAPFVPLYPMSNGVVRVQLKAQKSGQDPRYGLASFTVNRTSAALSYDGNGALLNLPSGLTLAYDAEGNLASVSSNGVAVTESWYDAAGRRIAKRENGVLTLYVWDGMEILATANADGTLREYYTRGPGIAGDVGSLVAEHSFATGQTVFLHGNHRGDVVLATDDAGAAVGRYEYSAFGMPLSVVGAYAPRFGFSSKERDASGLVYYGFRFLSPELCRWITPDPIREDGGLNLYRFCGNAPLNFVDTSGLKVQVVGSSDQQERIRSDLNSFIHTGGAGMNVDTDGFISREPSENPANDMCIEDDVDRLIDAAQVYMIHAFSKGDFGHFDPIGKSPGLGAEYWGTGQGGSIYYEPNGGLTYGPRKEYTMTGAQILAHELLGRALNDLDRIEPGVLGTSQRNKANNRAACSADRAWGRMGRPLRGGYR